MADRLYEVEALVEDKDGGADAHYDLQGTMTAEEFLTRMAKAMKESVKEMLCGGTDGDVGYKLTITIKDSKFGTPQPHPVDCGCNQCIDLALDFGKTAEQHLQR